MVKLINKQGHTIEIKEVNSDIEGMSYTYIFQEHHKYIHHKITGFNRCLHLLCRLFGYEITE